MTSYKYLGIDIHHKLTYNYSIEKRINGGWKAHFDLKNNCKSVNLVVCDNNKFLFETLVIHVILDRCEVWGFKISRENWRNIEQISNQFITFKLKVKRNTPSPIILIEVGLSLIHSIAMTRYLMYKHKINNMRKERLPKIALKSSQKTTTPQVMLM